MGIGSKSMDLNQDLLTDEELEDTNESYMTLSLHPTTQAAEVQSRNNKRRNHGEHRREWFQAPW